MVCIAAFIILALIGGIVAIISIFKPKVGKSYWKMFKKAWGCLSKKIRLQKCETGFKDDVKNTILSRVIIKHPKWAKPLGVVVEVISVLIVIVVVWALITAIKSLLALWALGTCNVTKPAACTLGAEMCSVDEEEPTNLWGSTVRWFEEWGEIFGAIPDKFHDFKAEDYEFNYISVNTDASADKPLAVDIFDPGCSVCATSFVNQKQSGFFDRYSVRLVPFAIQDAAGNYKFKNSGVIVKYLLAVEEVRSGLAVQILEKIFTEKTTVGENEVSYQTLFNQEFSEEEAVVTLEKWLGELGLDEGAIAQVRQITTWPEITTKQDQNRQIIEGEIHIKGIPTMIYDGKKYTGRFQS